MQWGELNNIWLIILLIVVVYLSITVFQWREKVKKTFADKELFPFVFPITSSRRYGIKIISFCVALFFIVIALMDPLFGERDIQVKREGIDMVFLLDLSSSMNAQDVAPSRLEKASKLISETLGQLGGDRAALVAFAANAYTISPLTNDYAAIESYLQNVNTDLISSQGTNYLNAINEAIKSFKGNANSSKLIVLISDGEDNEDTLNQAVKMAKDNDVNIVTIGVGTLKGGPIPVYYNGYSEDFKKDETGSTVITKLEDKNLRKLAKDTNGEYIQLDNTQDALSALTMYKSRLNKNEIANSKTRDMNHIFQWFLGIAVCLLFVELLTSEYKIFNKKK
ncbi:Ca-activated chloride channel family protein [Chishuiella changwenlii]|uniref:BatB protein n=1 Tax=Chishuiella changwenlii TaxID=1434701 RepID=A0A1M7CDI4_9FLAO|nr:VWA domain-containing protein [Chishuiella changwenlii]GGF06376.1 BatB protein [Chishuiella changwenlii]SHL65270.1 Ca-activated chloride channel family protein [Chishuiella changwenlii]